MKNGQYWKEDIKKITGGLTVFTNQERVSLQHSLQGFDKNILDLLLERYKIKL